MTPSDKARLGDLIARECALWRERAEKAEQARDAALSLATELLARFKCTGRVTYADGREVRSYAVLQGVSGAEYNAWCARLSPSDRIEPTPEEGKD
jgi:hypothetical protein